jgi:hypothetical protein
MSTLIDLLLLITIIIVIGLFYKNFSLNRAFTLMVLIISYIITRISWEIENSLENPLCKNNQNIKSNNKVILLIGSSLLSLSFAFFICEFNCGSSFTNFSMNTYLIITGILGALLIYLGATTNLASKCITSVGNSPNTIISLGILLILGSAIQSGILSNIAKNISNSYNKNIQYTKL